MRGVKCGLFASILLLLTVRTASAAINVAVEDGSSGGTGPAVVAQLNDDSFFDFQATLVTAADIDTAAELSAYDVVVTGGSGYSNDVDWTAPMWAAIRAWVESGGGVVMTGWGNYETRTSTPGAADLEAIIPTQNIPSSNVYVSGIKILDILDGGHPIVSGLTNFAVPGDYVEVNRDPPKIDDIVLATIQGSPGDISIAYKENVGGNGRTVYLGPLYFANEQTYDNTGLRTGDSDQLLEQAVAWAAGATVSPPPPPPPPSPDMTAKT